jgi:hypothetical protein
MYLLTFEMVGKCFFSSLLDVWCKSLTALGTSCRSPSLPIADTPKGPPALHPSITKRTLNTSN